MGNKNLKHRYMVGFYSENQTIYGKDELDTGRVRWADSMTLNQARKKLDTLNKTHRIKRVIYELVPVETID